MICLYVYATLYIYFTLIISFKNVKIKSTQVLLFHDVIYFDIYLYLNLKGFDVAEGGGIELISSIVTNTLSIPCNVLMGANLAGEIADGKFSETTIGIKNIIISEKINVHFMRLLLPLYKTHSLQLLKQEGHYGLM